MIKLSVHIESFFPRERFAPDSIASLNIKHFIKGVKKGFIMEMFETVEEFESRLLFFIVIVISLDF